MNAKQIAYAKSLHAAMESITTIFLEADLDLTGAENDEVLRATVAAADRLIAKIELEYAGVQR